jgi:hypothetical protein
LLGQVKKMDKLIALFKKLQSAYHGRRLSQDCSRNEEELSSICNVGARIGEEKTTELGMFHRSPS